ncbi:hypothetical protein E2562_024529 [Oryza meyeriana var. granulata]|uniref:Uncharacterized protein n=1 Tax=Oryza meyeriana var. granulata TaxID=110450 RepID=A0A6G1BNF5_9ORYZ|nr:hypothetical protein E2562_024529 [Oryza meyeriana var. granulata]
MARDGGVVVDFLAAAALVFLCCFHRPATAMTVDTIRYGPPRVPHRLGSVIAVDLGNTNSCVAGYSAADETAPLFRLCIPTSVAFADDGAALVGESAKNHPAAISGFKRLLGRRFDSPDVQRATDKLPYKIFDWCTRTHIEVKAGNGGAARSMYAADVASMVIAELKARGEAYLGGNVHNAVVTVPYYFSDGPREAAMNAARMAGLMTVRIIDEPTAAAVSHGLHRNKLRNGGNVLVLHVGGGTSDATVLTYDNAVFEALASRHDLHLGGDDFDDKIADHFVHLIKHSHGIDIADDDLAVAELKAQCERAKKTLTSHDTAQVNLHSQLANGVNFSFSGSLTRAQFEELNHDLFQKVISLVETAMAETKRAAAGFDMIDEVVLVGGSTRIPRIRELVKNYFDGKETTNISSGVVVVVEPDEAVVNGGGLLSHPMEDGYPCMGAGGRRQIGSPMDRCYHEW